MKRRLGGTGRGRFIELLPRCRLIDLGIARRPVRLEPTAEDERGDGPWLVLPLLPLAIPAAWRLRGSTDAALRLQPLSSIWLPLLLQGQITCVNG